MSPISRREVLQTAGTVLIGATCSRFFEVLPVFGVPPWEDLYARRVGSDGKIRPAALVPFSGSNSMFPRVGVGSDGRVWLTWIEVRAEREVLLLTSLDEAGVSVPVEVAPMHRRIGPPALAVSGREPIIVWCGVERDEPPTLWMARRRVDGALVSHPLAPNAHAPRIGVNARGDIWLVWEQRSSVSDPIEVRASRVERGDSLVPRFVAHPVGGDQRRPAVGVLADGRAWVVWDEATKDGNVEVRAVQLMAKAKHPARAHTLTHGGLNLAPVVALAPDGSLWVAWYTNVWPDSTTDVPRRVELACYSNGRWWRPRAGVPEIERETRSEVQGFEFPSLVIGSDGRLWLTGRASQKFYLTSLTPAGWSPLYFVPKDGWGGRGREFGGVFTGRDELVTVRRDLNESVVQRFGVPASQPGHIALTPFASQPRVSTRLASRIDFAPHRDFNFYFGDIHGHTSLSDGTGDVDEFYRMRRDAYALDFASLTDHDDFVGKKLAPSEWEEIKDITDRFYRKGEFVTLFGQEWTSLRVPRGGGHMNVYAIRRDVPLFDHTLPDYATPAKLVAAARQWGAIAIPHHIGWTGTVWEAVAPDVIPLVEIISVHGAHEYMGNMPIPHRGGLKGCFVQDGLARGLRFGLIGGTDCHGLAWHHGECWKRDPYRGGWAGVLAKELTREAVFEAFLRRRCYATSGVRMRLVFEINDSLMGEEIETSDAVRAFIDVNSESLLRWIEIVKNNETVYRFGGEGHHSTFRWEDPQPTVGTAYYYVRVICRDDNMGWSSPIWVTRRA